MPFPPNLMPYVVKPVLKALQVLEALAAVGYGQTLTQVAQRSGLPKTTAFRYLCTLRAAGMVNYEESSDLYRLSLRLWQMTQLSDERLRVREIARPYLYRLRDTFNETTNLGVLEEGAVVYLETIQSRQSLLTQIDVGQRDPVFSTALGKAILAFLPEERWPEQLPERFESRTPYTITGWPDLQRDLVETRRRGFSLDQQENESGATCIGVPILAPDGRPLAAISISGPASRMSSSRLREIALPLREVAGELARALG
jgi:DNA-binding IclR family transcriptional regulator